MAVTVILKTIGSDGSNLTMTFERATVATAGLNPPVITLTNTEGKLVAGFLPNEIVGWEIKE